MNKAKIWLRERLWARVLATVVLVLTFPVWMLLLALGMIFGCIFGGAYQSVTDWANDHKRNYHL